MSNRIFKSVDVAVNPLSRLFLIEEGEKAVKKTMEVEEEEGE